MFKVEIMPKINVGFLRVVQKLCTCVIYLIIALCVTTADGPSSCTLTNQSHLGRCFALLLRPGSFFLKDKLCISLQEKEIQQSSSTAQTNKQKKSSQKLGMKQFFGGSEGED